MSIKFSVKERPQPGVKGSGEKKWYAVAHNNEELGIDELTKQIEIFSTLSEAVAE